MNSKSIAISAAAVAAAITLATATTASAAPASAPSYSSAPAPGTGGLILRDINGSDLGEKQGFHFIKCGPKGSGLIKVNQYTRGGGGGWGTLYEGYVKQRYTQIPSMFPC